MGVRGLLPNLRDITTVAHVAEYRGMTAGVDASGWLHKGAYTCAADLASGVATDAYVRYCLAKVQLLLDYGVVPYLVFDGASLPHKRETCEGRGVRAAAANAAGTAAAAHGDADGATAGYRRGVRVTHEMARELAAALEEKGVRFVVAPYEADAQLAYLSRTGAVDVVVSEDGDCLPYGCRKVLFKLDHEGMGQEIALRNLAACANPLDFDGWSADNFLDLCILTGCDYLDSIPSVGPKTAHRFVREQRTTDDLLAWLATNYASRLPAGYCARFRAARAIFRHQTVFDAASGTTVPLTPLQPSAWADVAFLGTHLPADVACGVAASRRHPRTHAAFEAGWDDARGASNAGPALGSMPRRFDLAWAGPAPRHQPRPQPSPGYGSSPT